MSFRTNILLALFLVIGHLSYSQSSSLKVSIEGIEVATGQVRLCLIQNPKDYPDVCKFSKIVDVNQLALEVNIDNLPNGQYVLLVYHDSNKDGVLNKNFLGIPKEKYGFSNNPNSKFGLPEFDECIFEIKGDKRIVVEI